MCFGCFDISFAFSNQIRLLEICLSKKSNKRTNALKAKQKSVSMYVSVYTAFVHLSFAYLVLFDLVLFYTIDNYPVNTCLFCNLLSRLFK